MHTSKLFVFVIAFQLTSSLFAQTDSISYKSQIQFHLVNGYSLSYLNSLSNTSALRYKLDFNLSFGKENSDVSNSYKSGNSNSSATSTGTYDGNYQMLSFTTQYLWYPFNDPLVRIFVGTGPFLSLNRNFSSRSTNQTPQNGDPYSNEFEDLQYSLNVGVNGCAGVECFITKSLSLIGEYGVSASYGWSKQKNTSKDNHPSTQYTNEFNSESNSHGRSVGLGNLRLGIAFRF